MANTQIKVSVLSDLSKFDLSKVNKDLEGLDSATSSANTSVGKLGSSVGKMALPAAAAFGALTAGAIGATKSAEEAAATQAKLNEVFSSMGYSENAQAASDYASELSKIIGVDDDIIKGAQTKLATFSEVAKSTETMGRATTIAADLAAAGFGSMDSASVMLGKALQDPIKGVGALSRVGVTFTEDEKKMIEQMVKAGDAAGAQALIMQALETQVGGVAEASATGSAKLGVAFGEIGEAIGGMLLPAFETLMPLIQGFADWAANNPEILLTIAAIIGTIAGAVLAINAAMKVWAAISAVVSVANAVLGTSFTIALGPIALIIAAIAAVIAIGVLLYKNWDKISAWLKETWEKIKDVAVAVWNGIKDFFVALWNGIVDFLTAIWEGIKTAVVAYFEFYKTVITTVWNTVRDVAVTVWNGIKDFLSGLWNTIKDLASKAFNGLKDAVINTIGNVIEFLREFPGKILGMYANFYTTLFQKGKDLIQGMWNGIKEIWGNAVEWLREIPSKAADALGNIGKALFNKGKDLVQGLIDGIKSMAGKVVDVLLGMIPAPIRSAVSGLFRSADLASMTMSVGGIETRDFSGTAIGGYIYTGTGATNYMRPVVVNYNVSVESMVADRRAGTAIVDAIKEYERSAGGGWRR